MTTVYVAGPMRGYPLYNFPAFLAAAAWLTECGYHVLSPAQHDLDEGFDPAVPVERQGFDLRAAMLWDMQAVLRSEMVVTLDGWEASLGASAEVAVARAVGLRVVPLVNLMAVRA